MTSPNSVFTELVATTFRKHKRELVDNVSNNNAWLNRVMKSSNYVTTDGGLTIACPIEYANNGTYQRYSGLDTLNVSQSEVFSAVEFVWRQIALNVVSTGRELRINKGESRILNLAKSRIKNAMRTFKNNFSADLYSDGSLPNQINGLQALVSDSGLGTVGGIPSDSFPFWQNIVQSAAAPLQGGGAITPSATTIESLFLALWLELVRGDDRPDTILCSNDYFTFFEQSQTPLRRYAPADTGKTGFLEMKYKNADVIFDGGSGIPNSRAYFLNMDYFKVYVHEDANLTVMDEMSPYNQDGSVVPVIWMGNAVITNRRLQGVVKP